MKKELAILTCFWLTAVFGEATCAETNSTAWVKQVVMDGDGVKTPRDETYFRGSNAVFRTIKSARESYLDIGLTDLTVHAADTNGDGVFETIYVMQQDTEGSLTRLLYAFQRDTEGRYSPMSDEERSLAQKKLDKGFAFFNSVFPKGNTNETTRIPNIGVQGILTPWRGSEP